MARALAAVLPDSQRLSLARSFCASVIRTCWFEDDPAASLARAMGLAAARLDPITAGYLIGVTYTAMLPDETRSRLGVYYAPSGLASRLLDMATAAGADWRTCRVIDPACGGGDFPRRSRTGSFWKTAA